jgi:hypothetical protein
MSFNSGQKTPGSDVKEKRLLYKETKFEPRSSLLQNKYSLREEKDKSEKSVSLSRKSTVVEKRKKNYTQKRSEVC